MATANFNYLQRKRIEKPKHFELSRVEGSLTEFLEIELNLKKALVNNLPKDELIRLEVVGNREQYYSVTVASEVGRKKIELKPFPTSAKPSFKLFTVKETDKTSILRASTDFKLTSGKPVRKKRKKKKRVPVRREGFFNLEVSEELGSVPFKLDWSNGLSIEINSRLNEVYDGEPASDPAFRALVFPFLVKEILIGIVVRNDYLGALEETEQRWMKWACDTSLSQDGDDYPKVDFKSNGSINSAWLDWIDEVYEIFCSTKYGGRLTLLDSMEDENAKKN